ncbi:MAG: hypothetical protein Q7J98_04775 [Kiritimatiellia bacterium]|nr:hypothetical protein [Kiritimatiellia bacterium]
MLIKKQSSQWPKWFIGFLFIIALIMAIRVLAVMSDSNVVVYRLAAMGWGKMAEVIIQNKISALLHAALMTVCAGIFIWLLYQSRLRNQYIRKTAQWLLVAIVAADAFVLSRHYVKTMPLKAFAENDVIRILKSDMAEHRVALVSQEGFYNLWLTYLFPYHGIKTINATQMPRMPADYKQFFEAVGRNPLRLWQLSAVGFVLAPAQVWGQFQNEPAMKEAFEIVYAYNIKPADYYVEVIPATAEQPGEHVIMRLLKPAPRFTLIGAWETVNDAEVLRRFGTNDYQLFKEVMIAPECAAGLPDATGSAEGGQVQLLEYRPGKIKLRTSSTSPAILRVAEKYDPDWRVWIDGKMGRVLRADFIFQGIPLEPGMHEVLLEYAPSKWPLGIQGLGFLFFAGAIVMLLRKRKTNNL